MKILRNFFPRKYLFPFVILAFIGAVLTISFLIPRDETNIPYYVLNLSTSEREVKLYFINGTELEYEEFSLMKNEYHQGQRYRPDIDHPEDDIRFTLFYTKNSSGKEIVEQLGDFRALNIIICDENNIATTMDTYNLTVEQARKKCENGENPDV